MFAVAGFALNRLICIFHRTQRIKVVTTVFAHIFIKRHTGILSSILIKGKSPSLGFGELATPGD